MRLNSLLGSLLCLAALAVPSSAASVTDPTNCGNCWFTTPTSVSDPAMRPFWINPSQDTDVGSLYDMLVQDTFNLGMSQYYASSGGLAPITDFWFTYSPTVPQYNVQVLSINTMNNVSVGWYNPTNPAALNPLFNTSTAQVNATFTFSPGGPFGFYMTYINGPSDAFFTQTSLNSSGSGSEVQYDAGSGPRQHFLPVLISNSTGTLVGVEDSWGRNPSINTYRGIYEGNGDFQDAVFLVTGLPEVVPPTDTTVPEPSTVALMGFGFAGVFLYARSRKQK